MNCSRPVHGRLEAIGMIGLGHQDRFPMVSALVCMVTHLTRPMVSHDIRLSSNHNFTQLFHCVISQPWNNIDLMLMLEMTLTCMWDCKMIIYSLWIGSLLMEDDSNKYSQ